MAIILVAFSLFIGAIAKFANEKNAKWLVLVYFIVDIILSALFGSFSGSLLIVSVIKLPFVYLWLRLLHSFQDTVFTFLILLVLGSMLFSFAPQLVQTH